MHLLFGFLVVATLVIVVPGQDTALTIRNTFGGGRSAGVATACGVSCGQAVWALATSLGLAAILVASEPLYLALKTAGAAYLLWLGAACLWRATRRAATTIPGGTASRTSTSAAFGQGFVSNLGNPKMAVFFTSLLPQFAPGQDGFVAPLVLGLLFAAFTLSWLTAYAFAVSRALHIFDRSLTRRALDAVTGTVLVVLGIRLLAEGGKTG